MEIYGIMRHTSYICYGMCRKSFGILVISAGDPSVGVSCRALYHAMDSNELVLSRLHATVAKNSQYNYEVLQAELESVIAEANTHISALTSRIQGLLVDSHPWLAF